MRRTAFALALVCSLGFVGCSSYKTSETGAEVDVTGTVTGSDGKPVTGLNIVFQPGEAGARPESFPLKADGGFSGKMVVGKYLYYLAGKSESDRNAEALLSKFPAEHRKADQGRSVEVKGGPLKIKF